MDLLTRNLNKGTIILAYANKFTRDSSNWKKMDCKKNCPWCTGAEREDINDRLQ